MSDLRTRNNASSKKSYEKTIERQYADEYEHHMVRQHKLTHNDTDVFHWSLVPEEWLFDAGYITDFNKHRHERLMRKKEKKEGENRVRDYGFDGLARTRLGDNEIYSGLQAKYYLERQVCAKDIGSFLATQITLTLKNNLSKGYLYTTSKLQADLAGNMANPVYPIKHVLFPWKHPDARTVPKPVSSELECDKLLRKDQQDALKQLEDKDGINALNTPCRWGKTIVAGHHTKFISAKLVLAIAPLLISVENLQERLECFLPSYTSLVVDSDNKGTTIEDIKNFLASEGNLVIYSTFKSSISVLSNILTDYDNAYIVADEIHNANQEICDFIQKFPKGLVMSATLPEEIISMIDINHIVYIPFSQAIRDKIVVDYTVWLPYLKNISDNTTSVDIEIPHEFSTYDTEITAKAFYLATVMLKTGSHRCIAYLGCQEDCDIFAQTISQIFDIYHGLTIWTGKIDSTISKIKRKEILESFQKGQDEVYHILTSVRILDEAVDVPRCDSVFISNVGEKSSDIRMMQRSQRSSTNDPKNPSKHNNIILWADGWEKCIATLDLLREADPTFNKKIRIADSNYDKSGDIKRLEEVAKSAADWKKFENIQSLTREQTQLLLANQYVEFYKEYKRIPLCKREKDDEQSKLERKLFYAKKYWAKAVNTLQKGFKIYESVKLLMDKEIPGWSDTLEERQLKLVQKYIDFITKNQREPKNLEGETDIYNARKHWLSAGKGKSKHTLYKKSKILLDENLPNWCKNLLDKRQENANKIVEFYKQNNRLPKYVSGENITEEQKEENEINGMYRYIKTNKSDPNYKHIVIFLDTNIPDWSSDFYDIALERCYEIIRYHKENGDFPTDNSECSRFYKLIRSNIIANNNDSLIYSEISKILDEYYPEWRLTRQELRQKVQNDTVENIVKFYNTHKRFPISNKNDESEESVLGYHLILYRQFINDTGGIPISKENQTKLDDCGSLLWRSGNSKIMKTYIKNTKKLKEFVGLNGRFPKQKGGTDEESSLGRLLSKARQKNKKGDLPEECKRLFEEITGFVW